ncbi:Ig-like domain-containing protein [Hymenobacter sp. GOD-10R]|uniref:Ig-like domain-containing protein n=1 Tax=Hymenobacter sp. GOD-10R TaxID=3093922 RepID=UPI002D7827DB|nr:Ig-like domain-containing protein [Hymenobacter sp. GOD-10R]WRQ28793.1 Ig-like domain-containing protein [Hymenobacter sp. GOD-10R]
MLASLLTVGGTAAVAQAPELAYSAPITITRGGTYSGNYRSLDSNTPCVRVSTTEPVTLQNCTFAGAGDLIVTGSGADLTVRNSKGYGLTPTQDNRPRGRFVDAWQAKQLVVEHNYLEQTTGILANRWSGNGSDQQTIKVRYNQGLNCDGRFRNGGKENRSFVQLNTVQNLANIEVSYNEFRNLPNQSAVEDNMNFYNSSGTAYSPIKVHDNIIYGAYPYPATASYYSGTGMTTDGDGVTANLTAGYLEAYQNQFVSTCNAAMNIAAGHDIYYHDNRMVTSGVLTDGTSLNSNYAAVAIFNGYNVLASVFFNNRIENNLIGYVKKGANFPYNDRQDQDIYTGSNQMPRTGNNHLPNPITVATEQNEWTLWQQKLQQNGITVGVEGSTPTPAPSPAPTSETLVVNPGFEADQGPAQEPQGWLTATGQGTAANADYTETYPSAHTGTYHGTHYRPNSYEVYTYQTVKNLANGTYQAKAWVKSASTQSQLQVKNYGGSQLSLTIPATNGAENGEWKQVVINNIAVSNGQCELGFYTNAAAGQWLYFDDVELVKQTSTANNTAPTVALTAPTVSTANVAVTLSANAADTDGSIAKVEFFSGDTKLGEASSAPYQLSWTPTATGGYSLTARATDNSGATTTSAATTLAVNTPSPTSTSANYVRNPGFEADRGPVQEPQGWQTWVGRGSNANADYTETYPSAHTGTYHGTHYRPNSYEVYTFQILTNLPNGRYSVRAWTKSGGNQSKLYVRNYGGSQITTAIPPTPGDVNGEWKQVVVDNIQVTNGTCEVGFYSDANAGEWLYFDDVEVVQLDGASAQSRTANAAELSLYPNPSNDQVTLTAAFEQAGTVDIVVTTLQGTQMSHQQQSVQAGNNDLRIATYDLPVGTYILQLQDGTQLRTQRLMIER